LYGALVVKGDCPISRDHSRAVGQSPPARRGRVRRWLRVFRPSAILRGFPAACRARRDSLPADRGGRRPLRPNGPRGLPLRRRRRWSGMLLAQPGTVPGLPLRWAHRDGADAGSGHESLSIVNRDCHVSGMIRGELAIGRGPRAYTLVFGGSDADPDHDAAMRIDGEVPWRRAHSLKTAWKPSLPRVTATSDHYRDRTARVAAPRPMSCGRLL